MTDTLIEEPEFETDVADRGGVLHLEVAVAELTTGLRESFRLLRGEPQAHVIGMVGVLGECNSLDARSSACRISTDDLPS